MRGSERCFKAFSRDRPALDRQCAGGQGPVLWALQRFAKFCFCSRVRVSSHAQSLLPQSFVNATCVGVVLHGERSRSVSA